MKILILGASRLAGRETALAAIRRGHAIVAIGEELPEIRGVASAQRADHTSPAALQRLLLDEFPDAIINTASLPTPAACAANPPLATALNATLPLTLARMAHHLSARLIHLSTDLVFDGRPSHAPYANTATPAPQHLCGHTRLDGEKAILQNAAPFSTILRIPPLAGNTPGGDTSWHERLLAAWATNAPVPPPARDELRHFLSASNLADVIVELCERPNLTGIYHWASADALTPAAAARRLAAHFSLPPDRYVPADADPAAAAASSAATGQAGMPVLPSSAAAAASASPARNTGEPPVPRSATAPTDAAPAAPDADAPAGIRLDLRLDLHPLRGKLKTPVQNFDTLLSELVLPTTLRTWHALATGSAAPLPRLIKGVDF